MGAKIRGKDKRIVKATMTTPMHYHCRIRKMYKWDIKCPYFFFEILSSIFESSTSRRNIKNFCERSKECHLPRTSPNFDNYCNIDLCNLQIRVCIV